MGRVSGVAGVTGFCVVSAAVTQRTGSSAGHRKLHEAVTRHNAALFNLHRLSLHTPLLSHARVAIRKRAAHITPDCTHNTQTRRVSQSATDTPVRLWRVQPAACGSRRHASSRSARRPLLRLRVTAAAVRAPPVSLQASCAYTLVFFWMAEMSAQCVGHLARFFVERSADWMPASQCVWSVRSRPAPWCRPCGQRVDTRNLARDEGEERHLVRLDVVGLAYAGRGRRTLSDRSTAGIAARPCAGRKHDKPREACSCATRYGCVCNSIWIPRNDTATLLRPTCPIYAHERGSSFRSALRRRNRDPVLTRSNIATFQHRCARVL